MNQVYSKTIFIIFLIFSCLFSCQTKNDNKLAPAFLPDFSKQKIETITLANDTLYSAEIKSGKTLDNYEIAKAKYLENPNDVESIIWFGRRTAYLGRFQDAIDIYTKGISQFPKAIRLYRHRGHRYISTRQYDKAIADFEKAVTLIKGTSDQTEPDGIPNKRNMPISTLHGNIWYHLGLAYYLKNDMENAFSAYNNRSVTEKYPDNLVSGGHWLYMIQRRLGKDSAANASIQGVTDDMDIIENMSYHQLCLFYKQQISEEALAPKNVGSSTNDAVAYGLANWYLYHQKDTTTAKQHYQELLKNGNPYSFGYLAAEADWERLFE